MTGSNQRSRSFASATFSYDGIKDYERVEIFLTAATKLKKGKKMADSDALRSLPMILKANAAIWWNEIKDRISTWSEFETELRKTFAPKKPAYMIFSELGELRQQPNELTERFVAKQRALLNQLPSPGFTETQQLDMMYGFLHSNIRDQIPRERILSIDGLLEAARGVEQLLNAKPEPNIALPENRTGRKRVRCNFCRNFGHIADVCRKKQKVLNEAEQTASSSVNSVSSDTQESSPSLSTDSDVVKKEDDNCSSLKFEDIRRRPMIEISIGTANELAYIDSCARSSLASFKLYTYLKNIGFHFQEETTTVTLADGIAKSQNVLTGKVPVKVRDRCILTTFLVFPEARESKTLLGVGFIIDAGMILNLPQLTWNFNDEPDVHYDLLQEES